MEDMVIPDVMNVVFLPQGRYPESFVLISQLKVCQEGGGSRRGVLVCVCMYVYLTSLFLYGIFSVSLLYKFYC